ncbi:MAG: winged helix DNA-binding domain-containing protein [Thermoplasmata archaeon]|nr:winged helix DNA-binding domain-containing protein [Thermoplasmata archaeon]
MTQSPLPATLESVRRLAVTKQHLQGKLPVKATTGAMLSLVRGLAYVQWDPVEIVAPSHVLSLWSRVGEFQISDLDRLLWTEKKLIEHWTPIASLVLTEDYPLFESLMRRYPGSLSASWGSQRARAAKFLADHVDLRKRILTALRAGPLRLGEFEDHLRTRRDDGEWTPSSDVSQMLFHLQMSGRVMVVGHAGNQNVWGLVDDFLPDWTDRNPLSEEAAAQVAAERAIRALGTATPAEINHYFVRGRYQAIGRTLAQLEAASIIRRVHVEELGVRDERYVHEQDIRLLGSTEGKSWEPRLSLLPPFDNMLYDQARTNRLFGFDYVREQFLPQAKRKFGTYVLPILWGDRLIGRIDPRLDRKSRTLVINAVHAEPGAPAGREVADEIARAIRRLAVFVGATGVSYTSKVPAAWERWLH